MFTYFLKHSNVLFFVLLLWKESRENGLWYGLWDCRNYQEQDIVETLPGKCRGWGWGFEEHGE